MDSAHPGSFSVTRVAPKVRPQRNSVAPRAGANLGSRRSPGAGGGPAFDEHVGAFHDCRLAVQRERGEFHTAKRDRDTAPGVGAASEKIELGGEGDEPIREAAIVAGGGEGEGNGDRFRRGPVTMRLGRFPQVQEFLVGHVETIHSFARRPVCESRRGRSRYRLPCRWKRGQAANTDVASNDGARSRERRRRRFHDARASSRRVAGAGGAVRRLRMRAKSQPARSALHAAVEPGLKQTGIAERMSTAQRAFHQGRPCRQGRRPRPPRTSAHQRRRARLHQSS